MDAENYGWLQRLRLSRCLRILAPGYHFRCTCVLATGRFEQPGTREGAFTKTYGGEGEGWGRARQEIT